MYFATLYWIPTLYLFIFLGLQGPNLFYACLVAFVIYFALAIIGHEITKDMDK